MDENTVVRENVNLRVLLLAALAAAAGVLCFYLSGLEALPTGKEPWKTVAQQLGGSFVVTATLTVLWDLFARRAFLREILSAVKLQETLQSAGIVQVASHINGDIEVPAWSDYFANTYHVDLCFPYATTWRRNHTRSLERLSRRSHSRIRVLLPNPENALVVNELSRRLGASEPSIVQYIQEAKNHLLQLKLAAAAADSTVELYLMNETQRFTMFIFDTCAVFATFSHLGTDKPFPVIVGRRGGTVYAAIQREFDGLMSRARPCDIK